MRYSLWELLRAQLVSNDRLDVLLEEPASRDPADKSVVAVVSRRSAVVSRRRREQAKPEGRWFLLGWGRPDLEAQAVHQATLLLERYGVATRELALLDKSLLPWRILYEVLGRMELAGDVRRGYFVEGMSGAQFALPEAVRMMQDLEPASTESHPSILLHSLDPANLYGSGAPFDVPSDDTEARAWTPTHRIVDRVAVGPADPADRTAWQTADQPRGSQQGGHRCILASSSDAGQRLNMRLISKGGSRCKPGMSNRLRRAKS